MTVLQVDTRRSLKRLAPAGAAAESRGVMVSEYFRPIARWHCGGNDLPAQVTVTGTETRVPSSHHPRRAGSESEDGGIEVSRSQPGTSATPTSAPRKPS